MMQVKIQMSVAINTQFKPLSHEPTFQRTLRSSWRVTWRTWLLNFVDFSQEHDPTVIERVTSITENRFKKINKT